MNDVFVLTCPLSAWRKRQSCASILQSRRGGDALFNYAESRCAAQPPALASSASLTGPLLFLSHQFTDNDTHAQAGARSVIPLRALQRHYGGPEALEQVIVQMRTHIQASLEPSWTTAGRV